MRVLVFGGRKYREPDLDIALYDIHAKTPIKVIIHGNATGADKIGKEWAIENGLKHRPFPAQWDDIDAPGAVIKHSLQTGKAYNAAAGFKRNQEMIDVGLPDFAVMAPGGKGTADMLRRCKKAKLRVYDVAKGEWV